MNKGKRNALIEHRKKQTQAKDKRRAERVAAKTAAKK
jgi:4'-phosphopantetheinyl transferase EntD